MHHEDDYSYTYVKIGDVASVGLKHKIKLEKSTDPDNDNYHDTVTPNCSEIEGIFHLNEINIMLINVRCICIMCLLSL